MDQTLFDDNADNAPITPEGNDVPDQPVEQPIQPVQQQPVQQQPVQQQPVQHITDPVELALQPIANNIKGTENPAATANSPLSVNPYNASIESAPKPVRPTRPAITGNKTKDEANYLEYEKAQAEYDIQRDEWASDQARTHAQQEMDRQNTQRTFVDIANISLASGDVDQASAQSLVAQLSTIAEREPFIASLFQTAKSKGEQDVRALSGAFMRDPKAFIQDPINTIYNWAASVSTQAAQQQPQFQGNAFLGAPQPAQRPQSQQLQQAQQAQQFALQQAQAQQIQAFGGQTQPNQFPQSPVLGQGPSAGGGLGAPLQESDRSALVKALSGQK